MSITIPVSPETVTAAALIAMALIFGPKFWVGWYTRRTENSWRAWAKRAAEDHRRDLEHDHLVLEHRLAQSESLARRRLGQVYDLEDQVLTLRKAMGLLRTLDPICAHIALHGTVSLDQLRTIFGSTLVTRLVDLFDTNPIERVGTDEFEFRPQRTLNTSDSSPLVTRATILEPANR